MALNVIVRRLIVLAACLFLSGCAETIAERTSATEAEGPRSRTSPSGGSGRGFSAFSPPQDKPPVEARVDRIPRHLVELNTPLLSNRNFAAVGRTYTLRYALGKSAADVGLDPRRTLLESISTNFGDMLRNLESAALEVEFACEFCAPDTATVQREPLKYRDGKTNVINFTFTPSAVGDEWPGARKRLTLNIFREGIRYDQIEVFVYVVDAKKLDAKLSRPNTVDLAELVKAEEAEPAQQEEFREIVRKERDQKFRLRRSSGALPDISLQVRDADINGVFGPHLFVTTRSPLMDGLMALPEANLLPGGTDGSQYRYAFRLRRFNTMNEFWSVIRDSFLELSCLALDDSGGASAATRVFRRDLDDFNCRAPISKSLDWSKDPVRRNQDVKSFKEIGYNLYGAIFGVPGRDDEWADYLHEGFLNLAVYAKARKDKGNPVRIMLDTHDIPLQLVNIPQSDGLFADGVFFGHVFEIGFEARSRPRLNDVRSSTRRIDDVLVGRYGLTDGVADQITARGNNLYQCIVGIFIGDGAGSCNRVSEVDDASTTAIIEATSRVDFLQQLQDKADDLELIVTYLHGDARGWSSPHSSGLASASPRLIFALNDQEAVDYVTPGILKSQIDRSGSFGFPLARRPLVMLIACETGTRAPGTSFGSSYQVMFRDLGAWGVITTEAEIASDPAGWFTAEYLSLIGSSNQIAPSTAIVSTRAKVFEEFDNLWPLLFAYNGLLGTLSD
ncbi:MAG: hypothetical protein AAFR11_09365 [Pseudomonadota bacterium]